MKKIIFILSIALLVTELNAQQDAQFSQNMFNKLANNPGFAGSKQAICATAIHRSQWMGLEGAPTTLNLSVLNLALAVITENFGNIAFFSNKEFIVRHQG